MNFKKQFFSCFTGAIWVLLALNAHALDEAKVKKMIETYIKQNGDVLAESIQRHEREESLKRTRAMVDAHTPTRGPADAPVLIVEFSEFECPFCGRVQATLDELERRYEGRIRFAYKHLPLVHIHPKAMDAAMASIAAHKQGKFWEFSDILWERQEFSGERLWQEAAAEVGLDMEQFNRDRKSPDVRAMVEDDMKDAQSVGGRGTPYFLINGVALSGAQPVERFVEVIEAALAGDMSTLR